MHRMSGRCCVFISLERLIAFSKFLHITSFKKQQFWLRGPFGPRVGPMNRCGNDAAAVWQSRGSGAVFCACSIKPLRAMFDNILMTQSYSKKIRRCCASNLVNYMFVGMSLYMGLVAWIWTAFEDDHIVNNSLYCLYNVP
jgi:hypothetical protein